MKSKHAYIFLLIVALGCSQKEAAQPDGYVISGKVVGANGQTPDVADVHLSTLDGSYTKPLISTRVEDGDYSLTVEEPGMYRLWATATDHKIASAPVIIESGDSPIEVDFKLAMHDYKDTFDDIKVIGSWNGYSRASAGVMQPQDDGTFVFETEVTSDTVAYQLIGLVEGSRSMNGTQSDFFEYDGGGDYRSALVNPDDKVRIVFDPALLPRPPRDNEAHIAYDSHHQYLSEFIEIDQIADRAVEADKKQKEQAKAKGLAARQSDAFNTLIEDLSDRMQNAENKLVRQYAAMRLAESYYYDVKLDSETYSEILDTVPVTSPLWSLAIDPTALGVALYDQDLADTMLENIYRQNSDKTIQAKALANLAFMAQLRGDQAEYKTLYAELENKYQDVSAIRYQLETLNPDNNTAVGKAVPDFEVQLMSANRSVSNESLRGQYYLIDFWATWCGPCVREMPNLHQAYQEYKNHGLTILSLSLDSKPEDVIQFRKTEWDMPWLHAFLKDGWKSDMVQTFNVSGIPSPFLVSPEGRIVASHMMLRGGYLHKTLARVMSTN